MAVNNALRKSAAANADSVEEDKKKRVETTSVLLWETIEERGTGTEDDVERDIVAFMSAHNGISVKGELRAFFTLFTFFTRLPGPAWTDHHAGYLMRGMVYAPLVGGVIGVHVSIFFDAATAVGMPAMVAAAASTGAGFWLTGCFHEDGLADTADAFGGGWTRTQIKRIMADSRLGTYGCAVLAIYLLAKVALLAGLGASTWTLHQCNGAGPALLCVHVVARVSAVMLLRLHRYIADDGPKTSYYTWLSCANVLVTRTRVGIAIAVAATITYALYGAALSAILMAVLLLVTLGAGSYGKAILGGVMGDFLGATICSTELALLASITAAPKLLRVAGDVQQLLLADGPSADAMHAFALYATSSSEGRALLRLGGIVLITWLWSKYVGAIRSWPIVDDEDYDEQKTLQEQTNEDEVARPPEPAPIVDANADMKKQQQRGWRRRKQ